MNDLELLGEYVQKGSEAAFAELVRRHIDWVQGAALRQVGRRQMAEDVTQGVFIALVQQGRKLVARGRPLAPWLLKVVRYASIATLRAEKRRKQHEQGAAAMRAEVEKSLTEAQWEQMAPLLDELVGKLGKKDQEAVLLRFYQRKSLAEVGEEMGVSEAAAQKRVERAVEKLRGMYKRRGMAVGSGMVLAAGLEVYTTTPASAALVAATTQSALAAVRGGAVGGQLVAIAEGAMKMMRWTQVKVAVVVSIVMVLIGVPSTVVTLAQVSETLPGPSSSAAPPTTQVVGADELADAVAAARSRYPELTMTYVSEAKVGDAKGVHVGTRVQEVTLARRQPTSETFLDVRQIYKDVATGKETIERDGWAVFDGKSTQSLQRRPNGQAYRDAQMNEGKVKASFLRGPMDDPEWFWQPSLFDALRRKDLAISITDGDVIDGVRTLKAVLSSPEQTTTVWVAPDRSYLPLKVRTALKRTDIFLRQSDIGQLVQLENGQWFPKLITYHFGDPQKPCQQFRFKEVSTKIDDKRFSANFSRMPAATGGPKAALMEMVASATRLDAKGIIDGCLARTTEEAELVTSYAESLVAMERYRQAMEEHFGQDERYSRRGIGTSLAVLPLEQATEHITGEDASVAVITPGSRCLTIEIPMKRIAGRWRLLVSEMWDAGQKLMAADGVQLPPMKSVSQEARKTAPAYKRVADLVKNGKYSSKDDAVNGLQAEMARARWD